jgi:hypothetical protein
LLPEAALIIAKMPALIASGGSGHASITAARSVSSWEEDWAARFPCAAGEDGRIRKRLIQLGLVENFPRF